MEKIFQAFDAFLAEDGSNNVNGRSVTTPDGKKLFAGSNICHTVDVT